MRHTEAAMAPIKAQRGVVLTAGDLLTAPDAPESNSTKRMRPAALEPTKGWGGKKRPRTDTAAAAAAAGVGEAETGLAGGGGAASAGAEPEQPEAEPFVATSELGDKKSQKKKKKPSAAAPASCAAVAAGAGAAGAGPVQHAGTTPALPGGVSAAVLGRGGPTAPAPQAQPLQPRQPQPPKVRLAPPAAEAPPLVPLGVQMELVCMNIAQGSPCASLPRTELVIGAQETEVECCKCGAVWNRHKRLVRRAQR